MVEIKIPKLGLTMEKATIVEWRFKSGDLVNEGDIILVIETDKVSFEVPAPCSGIIHPVVSEGSECTVEDTVGYIASDRAEYQRLLEEYPPGEGKPPQNQPQTPKPLQTHAVGHGQGGGRIKASPLARSMAKTHGIDLTEIKGTGPGGRIVRADILAAIEEKRAAAQGERPEAGPKEVAEAIPISGPRRVIFQNMFKSLSQSAQLTLHAGASAENLIALRQKASMEAKISLNAILVKIVAEALRLHPRINSTVEGDKIIVWKQVNIGLAMEAGESLVVPVIREPRKKGLLQINEEINILVQKAREGRLSPDDMAGGTFTVTNLGFLDIDYFTPIIRPPESAILGVGRVAKVPVVFEGQVVPQTRIHLSLTFDHRIIDGAPAARFLKTIMDFIEDPAMMLF